jgi:uncharacterized protein YjbI with pentapeptide repeats
MFVALQDGESLGQRMAGCPFIPTQSSVYAQDVNDIATCMADGRWEWPGNQIVVDRNGVLIDGHHRVVAAWITATAIETRSPDYAALDPYLGQTSTWEKVTAYQLISRSQRFERLGAARKDSRSQANPTVTQGELTMIDIQSSIRPEVLLKVDAETLEGAELNGASLHRASLARAKLRGATLREANLRNADLTAADLSEADLTRADLANAGLDEARLRRACLCSARMPGARACNADFRDADLRDVLFGNARLSGAQLQGADLRGARLEDADLQGVTYDELTQWPQGLDPAKTGAIPATSRQPEPSRG